MKRRRRPRRLAPAGILAEHLFIYGCAVVVLLLVGGAIWILVSR